MTVSVVARVGVKLRNHDPVFWLLSLEITSSRMSLFASQAHSALTFSGNSLRLSSSSTACSRQNEHGHFSYTMPNICRYKGSAEWVAQKAMSFRLMVCKDSSSSSVSNQ